MMAKNNDITGLSNTDNTTLKDSYRDIGQLHIDVGNDRHGKLDYLSNELVLFILYIPPSTESFHADTQHPRVDDKHGYCSCKSFLSGLISAPLNDLTT